MAYRVASDSGSSAALPKVGQRIPDRNINGVWRRKILQEITLNNPNSTRTHGIILRAPSPDYTHVRAVLVNGEATPPTVSGLAFAATASNANLVVPTTGNTLTNDGATGWVRGTFNGANTATMPAAGADVNNPGQLYSDWIPLNSIAPTDGAGTPYLMCRVLFSAAFSYSAIADDDSVNVNTVSLYQQSYRATTDGDYITTPQSMTAANASPNTPFWAFEFISSKHPIRIACVGDSITAGKHASAAQNGGGSSSPTKQAKGWWQQSHDYFVAQGIPISLYQVAVGGTTTTQYSAFGKLDIAGSAPVMALYSLWSPNDGPTGAAAGGLTQKLMNVCFQRAMDFAMYCRSNGVIPVFTVLAPNNNYSSADDTLLLSLINRAKAASLPVIDLSTAISTSAVPRQFLSGMGDFDGIHPITPGYTAMASSFQTQLLALVRQSFSI